MPNCALFNLKERFLKGTSSRNADCNSGGVFAKFNRRKSDPIGYYRLLFVIIILSYIFILTRLTD